MEDGKAQARPVRTGVSDLTDTVILEGVEEGDQVITGPFRVLRDLEDGVTVALQDEDEDAQEPGAPSEDAQASTATTGAG